MKAAGFIGRVIVSGGTAAITSAIVAAVCSRLERGRAAPPLNAVSHILSGGPPPADAGPAGVNMVAGLVLHAGAAAFWATPFELLFGRIARRSALGAGVGGAAVSALAFVTDYYVVPRRFRPGYEAFLSGRGLFALYAALAAGLALGARLTRLDDHQPENRDERDKGGDAEGSPDRVITPEAGR